VSVRYVTTPDNFVQAPVRWLSGRVARLLLRTPITPNQITVTRGLINVVVLALVVEGSYRAFAIAFVLFQVFELLDHVDGDLARLRGTTSSLGALMETFLDTYGARPSSLFGLCVALGMTRQGGGMIPLYLYSATALGRLLWLEYRGPFGWNVHRDAVLGGEHGHYLPLVGTGSRKRTLSNLAVIVYTWQNQFILWGGLLSPLVPGALLWAMGAVAVLNHLPWVIIVADGFRRARINGT
jgi:phosphatidylglycerophosphate synthase